MAIVRSQNDKLVAGKNISVYLSKELLSLVESSSLKAGRGIPCIDSIILSTFMLSGCREVHATDRNHFAEIKNKGISFVS